MAAPIVSSKVAKERLSIMLVRQRNTEAVVSLDMEKLQKEVAMVVQKYIKVADNKPAHLSVKQEETSTCWRCTSHSLEVTEDMYMYYIYYDFVLRFAHFLSHSSQCPYSQSRVIASYD